ncbi:MAG TPA: spermidine synthase [Patescibacteria group bacterium]|nr:spermidine synthase [Patescibacteria group bacterium]
MKPESLLIRRVRLFLVSFLTLFLELALIRFIPANIELVGYFSNLILLGAFLGIGIGLLSTKRTTRFFTYFPWLLALLLISVMVFKMKITVDSPGALFFKGLQEDGIYTNPLVLLPLLFSFVVIVFASVSQEFGIRFRQFPALAAYVIDLAGALTAIILFSVFSALSSSPFLWFLVIVIATIGISGVPKRLNQIPALLLLIIIPFIPLMTSTRSIWSPYSKLTVTKTMDPHMGVAYNIDSNNISHQFISDYRVRERFYYTQYEAFPDPNEFKQILIIGAGTGADVATALNLNPHVVHIDAVEIDPEIVKIGKLLNPNKPFDDPRVSVIINDGRNYLERTRQHYDLIIFALTDSVVLTSAQSNIRLESFLFTEEAFSLVKQHLTPDGLFVLYNYYREQWLIDRIALMIHDVFGQNPLLLTYGDTGKAATFMAGPKILHATLLPGMIFYHPSQLIPTATDDWPFTYVKNRTIPPIYSNTLLAIVIIAFLFVFLSVGKNIPSLLLYPQYFFLGLGFMLLETKNLVTFGLLFGNTWAVNAMVFAAILTSTLLSAIISRKYTVRNIWRLYALLIIVLAANALTPAHILIAIPQTLRYILASIYYFAPVFIANLIFSQTFKEQSDTPTALGVNMLGAMVGGILEYTAMVVGYQALYSVIIISYLCAFIPYKRR